MRLEQLYRDPLLREEMGNNARKRALEYGWATFARVAAQEALDLADNQGRSDARL
jgi:hypothetical protein